MKNAFGDEIEETAPAGAVNAFGDPVEAEEKPGMLSRMGSAALDMGLGAVSAVGRTIDRVTTAPARAAIADVQANREARGGRAEGLGKFMDPEEYLDVGRFGAGYLKNFARDPDQAPTPKETAESYGVPDTPLSDVLPSFYSETGEGAKLKRGGFLDPTASGTAGMAAEMVVPIPGKAAARTLGAVGKGGVKVLGAIPEGAAKVADAATGTKAASRVIGAAKTLGKSIDETTEGLGKMLNAKQADDFGESVKIAMANGIDAKLLPESVEFGPSSVISRSARVKAEGPLGQPMLEKFQEGLEQVQGAVRADIEKIGMGAPLAKPEAGAILREGFNQGVDRAFESVKASHKGVIAAAPDLRLSQAAIQKIAPKLQELEAWAMAKAENGVTNTAKEQGRQIQNAINAFRRKGESYAGAYEALQEIGDVAFKSKNTMADIAPDISRFRKLYGDVSEAMIGTVDDVFGADQGRALRESNQAMSKIFGDKSLLGKIGDSGLSDEALFTSLVERGDTKRILALKEYLEPEQLAALKGAFLDGLIKENPEGGFPFRSLHNALRQKNTVASALFEPGELDNLQGLIKLGDKFGNAVMSTSGTAASNAFSDLFRTARDRGADALITDPIKKKARAIGFDIEEAAGRAAAKRPGPGPVMGFGPGGRLSKLPEFNPRAKAARAYSIYDEEDDE